MFFVPSGDLARMTLPNRPSLPRSPHIQTHNQRYIDNQKVSVETLIRPLTSRLLTQQQGDDNERPPSRLPRPTPKQTQETNSELEEAIRKIADAYNERFRNAPETLRIELQPQIDEMLLGEVDTSGVEVSPAQRRGIAIFWVYSKHPVLGDETLAAGTATLTAALGEEGAREYIRSRRLAGAASRAANRNAAASE